MILLSNLGKQSLPTKKIQIKPLQIKRKEAETTTLEDKWYQLNAKENELKKMEEELEKKVFTTNEEIEKARLKWDEERIKITEDAQQEGYEKGFEQGKIDGHNQYVAIIDEANTIVSNAQKDYYNIIQSSDKQILDLALSIAEKIVNTSIQETDVFLSLVSKAIQQVKEQPTIKIYVSNEQYDLLLENKDELARITNNQAGLLLYVDTTLTNGQVYFVTPFGKIDASINTQLGEIRTSLTEIVEELHRGHNNAD